MDPNACYKRWWRALLEENADEAREAYTDLCTWIGRGGFEPSWSKVERAQFFTFSYETGMLG